MSMSFAFRGIIVPVFTPFLNDSKRSLNLGLIPQYADYLAKKGITGVLVNGTTGEGTSMSVAERKMVTEAWANAVKTTKQHLMIQVGGAPLPDVLELAKHAESIKADSILCLPELYFKPGCPQQLIEYLKLVSEAAPRTPLLYYHIPMFTHVNIHMGKLLECIGNQVPTFVGIKFTSNNLEEAAQAGYADNKKFIVFLGNDMLISGACALGMDSLIGTSVNMFPELANEILKAGKAGNGSKSMEKQEELTKIVVTITKYGNWVESMKLAMPLLTNINPGPPRAPLSAPTASASASLASDLQKLGYRRNM